MWGFAALLFFIAAATYAFGKKGTVWTRLPLVQSIIGPGYSLDQGHMYEAFFTDSIAAQAFSHTVTGSLFIPGKGDAPSSYPYGVSWVAPEGGWVTGPAEVWKEGV